MALSYCSFRRLPALRNALLPGLLAVSACSAGESAPLSHRQSHRRHRRLHQHMRRLLLALPSMTGPRRCYRQAACSVPMRIWQKAARPEMSTPAISTTSSSRLHVAMRACLLAWRRQTGWMRLMRCRPLAVVRSPEPGWRRASSSAFKRSAAPDRIRCITTSLRFLQTASPDARTTRHAEHMATGRSNA